MLSVLLHSLISLLADPLLWARIWLFLPFLVALEPLQQTIRVVYDGTGGVHARQDLVKTTRTGRRTWTAFITAFVSLVAMVAETMELTADVAARSATKIASAYRIPVLHLDQLFSAVNELSSETNASGAEIIDFLLRVGPSAANLGIAAEDMAAIGAAIISADEGAERGGRCCSDIVPCSICESAGVQSAAAGVVLTGLPEVSDIFGPGRAACRRRCFDGHQVLGDDGDKDPIGLQKAICGRGGTRCRHQV